MTKPFKFREMFDGRQQELSDLTATVTDPEEVPIVRPEFAAECDLNVILSRAVPFEARPIVLDEVNYDENLTTALQAVQASREAWALLPPEVTSLYGNWLEMAKAAADGRLKPPGGGSTVPVEALPGAPPAGEVPRVVETRL